MTLNAIPGDRQLALPPVDEKVDHVRGSPAGPLILEYGDYECPYSRQAFHAIEQVGQQLGGNVRFAFRRFPLARIHPHAPAAFDRDRASTAVADRIRRDVDSGLASGQVLGTPPCSSTAWCTAAATTRPPCWPR